MTTILDITPRIAARSTSHPKVAPERRHDASVSQIPNGNPERRAQWDRFVNDGSVIGAIEALSILLTQADTFSRNSRIPVHDRREFTGQVQAYAFAVGVVVHPLCPPDAVQVKRDILAALDDGPLTSDEIREIAVAVVDPPDAS